MRSVFGKTMRSAAALLLACGCLLLGACDSLAVRKPTATFHYEVDAAALEGGPVDMAKLLDVVNERLGDDGTARALDTQRFAVDVFGEAHEARLNALRQRIEANGRLEFRIMASSQMAGHQDVIRRAEALAADEINVVDSVGAAVARWVDCEPHEFPDDQALRDRRLVARPSGSGWQALVLLDDGLDVGDEHLEEATMETDETGRPQVGFRMTRTGAFLFGQLTSQHLPTPTGERFNLGIVLDDRLLFAPTIESRITDRGRISGRMLPGEVEAMSRILNAGRLPYPIREIHATVAP